MGQRALLHRARSRRSICIGALVKFFPRQVSKQKIGVDHIVNSIGLLFLLLFLTLAMLSLAPFHCVSSPNGTLSLVPRVVRSLCLPPRELVRVTIEFDRKFKLIYITSILAFNRGESPSAATFVSRLEQKVACIDNRG